MPSTPYGGYGSKAAQSAALARAMAASYAKYPGAWKKAGTTPSKLTRQQNAVQQAKQAQQARIKQQQAEQQAFQNTLNKAKTYKLPDIQKITPQKININVIPFLTPEQQERRLEALVGKPRTLEGQRLQNLLKPTRQKQTQERLERQIQIANQQKQNRDNQRKKGINQKQVNPKPKIEITDLQGKPIDTGDLGIIRKADGTTDITGISKTNQNYKNLMKGDVLLKGMTNTSKNPTTGGISTLGEMAITDNYSLGGPRNLVSRNKIPTKPISTFIKKKKKNDYLDFPIPFQPPFDFDPLGPR